MDVSDILRDRMHEPDGLQRMAAVSALAHAAFFAMLILAPSSGLLGRSDPAERRVMTISLGGGPSGEDTGGRTAMSARPIQAAPVEVPKRPEPVRPPAQKAPAMTVPAPNAPRVARGAEVKNAPPEARGTTPTKGAEPAFGTALADTGVTKGDFGLATGGGTGTGSRLDVGDFCCPDYISQMVQSIRRNWDQKAENTGQVSIRFTIQRNGAITDVGVDQPSPYVAHNLSAQRAVLQTRQLRPLPEQFPNPTLTVYLNFIYER